MVGLNLVWNQFADHLGFQVRVANAYQAKDMTITRSEIGVAEAGRGDTEIEVQSYVAEVSYQFSDGVKTSYRPYFASRRAIIKQDGYTETGVDNPLTFNTLEDKSTTLVMGMKAKHKLNNTITLNGALGVEHDISNNVDKIQATSSTINGLTPVDLNTSINKTRPVVTLGATYSIRPNQSLVAQTQYQELSYTSNSAKTAYFNYNIGF
jgi:outer membrane autotransporter protein